MNIVCNELSTRVYRAAVRWQGSDRCDDCRHARDGPYCVARCPLSKYRDENGVCQLCSPHCEEGCSGPRNTVGEGGCNSCALVEFGAGGGGGEEVSTCLAPESNCSDGYYRHVLPGQHRYKAIAGKQVGYWKLFKHEDPMYKLGLNYVNLINGLEII